MSRLWMILLLLLVWMGFCNDYSTANFILGLIIATACHFSVKRKTGGHAFKPHRFIYLLAYVFYELIVSSIAVSYEILTPRQQSQPAIIKIDLHCTNDIERTLLANLISLTPGTLSLHVDKNKNQLILHVMFNHNTEKTLQYIYNTFEPKVKAVFSA